MQWLYVDFPFLQLDHFIHELAEDKHAALVVFCPVNNEILQVSGTAASAGIQRGMGLAQASALQSSIQLLPYSFESENRLLTLLASQLYQIASDIVLLAPQGLAIKLDPIIHYYQSVGNFVALFHHTLQQTGLRYHFATGPTVETAQALAKGKVDTIYETNAQAICALQSASLAVTALSEKHITQFNRMGIRSLHAVFQIPLEELGKRFDNTLISYVLALKGNKHTPRPVFHPSQRFQYQCELPFELEDSTRLLRFLTHPVEQCCAFLKSHNLTTDTLVLMLHLADSPQLQIDIRSGAPLHNAQDWLSLLSLKLEQIELTSPLRGFQLCCDNTVVFHATSDHLFAERFSKHAENMLMGALLAKLGQNAVQRPKVRADHRADLQVPFSKDKEENSNAVIPQGQQPCWLISPPRPLTDSTRIIYGPERLQTGWWDNYPVKRDYFIATNAKGQRLWVFRDHDSQWFVHGYFS